MMIILNYLTLNMLLIIFKVYWMIMKEQDVYFVWVVQKLMKIHWLLMKVQFCVHCVASTQLYQHLLYQMNWHYIHGTCKVFNIVWYDCWFEQIVCTSIQYWGFCHCRRNWLGERDASDHHSLYIITLCCDRLMKYCREKAVD